MFFRWLEGTDFYFKCSWRHEKHPFYARLCLMMMVGIIYVSDTGGKSAFATNQSETDFACRFPENIAHIAPEMIY